MNKPSKCPICKKRRILNGYYYICSSKLPSERVLVRGLTTDQLKEHTVESGTCMNCSDGADAHSHRYKQIVV